jgi:hypothetical protein
VTDGARTRDLRSHNPPTTVSGRCTIGLSKPISLLTVAHRFCMLRPQWCQQWCQYHHRVGVTRRAIKGIRAALLSPSKQAVDVFSPSSPLTLLSGAVDRLFSSLTQALYAEFWIRTYGNSPSRNMGVYRKEKRKGPGLLCPAPLMGSRSSTIPESVSEAL